jgi:hypothetical protein
MHMTTTTTKTRLLLVNLLPSVHLCACLIFALAHLERGWDYLFFIDIPVSFLLFGLSYNFNHPPILYGLFGTLWWYLLSFAAAFCWIRVSAAIRNRRTPRTEANRP